MPRPVSLKRVATSFLVLAALTVLASGPVTAQEKPFAIVGAGIAPQALPLPGQDPRPHWIIGVATNLGLHYGEGTVKTDTAIPDPANGKITGNFGSGSPFVFTGLNGDKLVCNYGRDDLSDAPNASEPGTFELTILDVLDNGSLVVEAFFIAEFVVDPKKSTGKFKGVKGSWIMYAQTVPFVLGSTDPVEYAWAGAGKLTYPKKK